jgi:porin
MAWTTPAIQLTINDRRGNSASEDLVGNRLPIQENYGGLYTRLTELSYERTLFTPALNVKLGYMAMGNDLGGLDSGILCNFMNAGFCGHPLNMSGGSGWTNYPNAHLGVRVKYDLSPSWQLRVAAFNVDPESNGNSSRAWQLGPKHTTGTVVPIELVYKQAGTLPGEYKLGYYYDSSDVKRIGSNEKVSGRGGHYLLIDQAVWASSASAGRVLHAFGQYSAASEAASPFSKWYGAGWCCTNRSKADHGTPSPWVTAAPCRTHAAAMCRNWPRSTPGRLSQPEQCRTVDRTQLRLPGHALAEPAPDVQYIIEPGRFRAGHRQCAGAGVAGQGGVLDHALLVFARRTTKFAAEHRMQVLRRREAALLRHLGNRQGMVFQALGGGGEFEAQDLVIRTRAPCESEIPGMSATRRHKPPPGLS